MVATTMVGGHVSTESNSGAKPRALLVMYVVLHFATDQYDGERFLERGKMERFISSHHKEGAAGVPRRMTKHKVV